MREIFYASYIWRARTCAVVDVEFEVGDVHQPRVLVQVHHVRIESRQVEDVFGEAGQGQL